MSGKSGGKRAPRAQTTPTVSAPARGTPVCPAGCGFAGWPSAESTPHVVCGGDPARHVRTPVGAR